jgi:predicted lipoprotein with Yx(FWY)xxD motif
MKPTRMRLVGIAAAAAAIAIAAPVATAGAATAAPAVAPVDTVIGPTFTTTAPATFINTNTQVSSAVASAGNQIAS